MHGSTAAHTRSVLKSNAVRLLMQIADINALPDPCPLPGTIKRRGLNDKERLLYAPMADVGGLLYDKDAVYIDIPDWKVMWYRLLPSGRVQPATLDAFVHITSTQLPQARNLHIMPYAQCQQAQIGALRVAAVHKAPAGRFSGSA